MREQDLAELSVRETLNRKALRRYWEQVAHQREEEKREREGELEAEGDLLEAAVIMLASPVRIEAFEARLDLYDEATVKALMENERRLDIVDENIGELLGRAYVLPDGRRVFQTQDGLRVFDEHGAELSPEEIDPGMIEDHRPYWETFKGKLDEKDGLIRERQDLLEFQERLDGFRERLDDEGLTEKDLDDMELDLEADVPDAVKRQLGELQPKAPDLRDTAHNAPQAEPSIASHVVKPQLTL
jgi:hypothetical protein